MNKKTILAAMVDYYTSDCLIDFHKNWLKMKFTLGHRLRTIRWLKMKYKEQIQKKGKYLVFSGVDGLLLFKFSKDLWGSEIVSDSENEEGEQQLVL